MPNEFITHLLGSDTDTPDSFRTGTISGNSPLEVNIAEQSGLSAAWVQPYTSAPGTAAIGDLVLILQTQTDYVVIGRIISGG